MFLIGSTITNNLWNIQNIWKKLSLLLQRSERGVNVSLKSWTYCHNSFAHSILFSESKRKQIRSISFDLSERENLVRAREDTSSKREKILNFIQRERAKTNSLHFARFEWERKVGASFQRFFIKIQSFLIENLSEISLLAYLIP